MLDLGLSEVSHVDRWLPCAEQTGQKQPLSMSCLVGGDTMHAESIESWSAGVESGRVTAPKLIDTL